MNNKQYKRQTRQMPQYVKDKISASLTGRKLSDETKRRISDGQKRAWAMIPQKQDVSDLWPTNNNKNENKDQKGNGTEKENTF